MASMIALRLEQGNTVTKQFTAFNGTASADLTGYNVVMTIKSTENTSDGDPSVIRADGTVIDAPNGVLQVTLPGSDLQQAQELWYRIDALLETDPTQYFTIVKGPLYIEPV